MDNNIKLSLISIINKKEIYEGFRASLQTQINIKYELIPIFNLNNELNSPRSAFNAESKNAKGEYIVFIHPDIRFTSPTALCDIASLIDRKSDFGVMGVAGALPVGKNKRHIISSIYQGPDKIRVGSWNNNELEEVQTVDECLFIVRKEYFLKHQFGNIPGWHLYAVEYCLNSLIDGKKNYVVQAAVWHLSPGNSLDPNYVKQLDRIIKKYRKYFDQISTTVKAWPTHGLYPSLYRRYYYIKQMIKQRLKEII